MEVKPAAEETQQKQEVKEEEQQQEERFHVLAVDDSLIDRKLLERLLRVSSFQVTCVESGDKALEFLGLLDDVKNASSPASSLFSSPSPEQEEMKINLIMTDYCMPGMSGYDLLRKVKGSLWKDVPVVIMSSENIPSRINMCLEGGAEEFLLKPLQLSDVEKLQHHLLKSQKCSCNGNVNAKDSKSNINFTKRKANLAETSERRPKLKEVTVI